MMLDDTEMTPNLRLLAGIGIGAGLMYLFDPDRGRRRRARLRDQFVSLLHSTDDALDAIADDLSNRARGTVAETRARLREGPVDDVILVERVRSKMGRVVSHPSAIEVTADQGRVMLRGPILAHEVNDLLAAASSVRGVRSVENQLVSHEQAGDIPALQGVGHPRPGMKMEFAQRTWAPGPRVLAGGLGALLALGGFGRRDIGGTLLASAGLVLAARALTNMPITRLLGFSGGRGAIEFHKTLTINAPVPEVFAFWQNLANFPRFMAHVREVQDHGNGRWHWKVDGPAGMPVEWEATITRLVPNQLLAWKSLPGEAIQNAGIIRFEPTPGDRTRLDMRLSYTPPAGALGHAVAALFGADPKRALDDDMVRLKSLIEEGKTSAHGETVTRAEVMAELSRPEQPPGAIH